MVTKEVISKELKNIETKLKKKLYEIENKKNISDEEKGNNYDNLVELVNTLNKKRQIINIITLMI